MKIYLLLLILGFNPVQDLKLLYSEHTYKEALSSRIRLPLKEAPKDLALPAFQDKKVFFAHWSSPITDHKPVWMAVDRSQGSEFYDTLYVDLNCNNSLADEKAIMAVKTSLSWSCFKPIRIRDYQLHMDFFGYPKLQGFYAGAAAWRQGKVKLGAETAVCRLIDFNSNGIFNDTHMTNSGQQDRIVLDGTTFHMGKYIRYKGTFYQVRVKPNGASIGFEKMDASSLGLLNVSRTLASLTLGGVNGQHRFKPEQGEVRAPLGEWRIIDWQMDQGAWSMRGFDFPKNHGVTIPGRLQVGEGVKACLNIHKTREGYEFKERLEGAFGEKVEIDCSSDAAQPPMLLVVNSQETHGELLDFKYG